MILDPAKLINKQKSLPGNAKQTFKSINSNKSWQLLANHDTRQIDEEPTDYFLQTD